jgi:hypothetical protein
VPTRREISSKSNILERSRDCHESIGRDGGPVGSAGLHDVHEARDRRFDGVTRSNVLRGRHGLGHE